MIENGLTALLSWNLWLFSLGIYVIIWLFRTIIEYVITNITKSNLWDKLILPISPPTIGALSAFFIKQYPYPDGIASTDARILFGLVAGFFSGTLYLVLKGMLKSRIQGFTQSNNQYQTQPQPQPQYQQPDYSNMNDRARQDPPISQNPQIIPFSNG
jgi:hypothetical protein